MQIVAIVYAALIILNHVFMPFWFGEERKPYSPSIWLASIIINTPVVIALMYFGLH